MSRPPNPMRGEAAITVEAKRYLLRPSFAALVAAEEELGSLFAMVERASRGELALAEIAGLLWHCMDTQTRPSRDVVGAAVLEMGLVEALVPLRIILGEALRGTK